MFYLPFSLELYRLCVGVFPGGVYGLLDGYLARKLDQSTPFGAFLDPVADKLMVAIALGLLVERFGSWWFTIPAIIIIGREIVISALREWMAELGKRTSVGGFLCGQGENRTTDACHPGAIGCRRPIERGYWQILAACC